MSTNKSVQDDLCKRPCGEKLLAETYDPTTQITNKAASITLAASTSKNEEPYALAGVRANGNDFSGP